VQKQFLAGVYPGSQEAGHCLAELATIAAVGESQGAYTLSTVREVCVEQFDCWPFQEPPPRPDRARTAYRGRACDAVARDFGDETLEFL